jgi:hypothetical protein
MNQEVRQKRFENCLTRRTLQICMNSRDAHLDGALPPALKGFRTSTWPQPQTALVS